MVPCCNAVTIDADEKKVCCVLKASLDISDSDYAKLLRIQQLCRLHRLTPVERIQWLHDLFKIVICKPCK
jgi:hypothetical protein